MKEADTGSDIDAACAIFDGGDDGPLDFALPGTTDGSNPEIMFWRRVIIFALFDLCTLATGSAREYHREASLRWFLKSRNDFRIVCEMAAVEPAAVREMVAAAIDDPHAMKVLRKRIIGV